MTDYFPPGQETRMRPTLSAGSSITAKVLAVAGCGFAVAVALVVGLSQSDLSTLLTPALILGANGGFFVAGGACVRLDAFPDRVELKNAFRYVTIRRDNIAGLNIQSGIYFILKNRKMVVPSAYTPTLGKRFGSNDRASVFGMKLAELLNVEPNIDLPAHPQQLSPGTVVWRLRWEMPLFMLVGALICAGIAVLARYA